MSYSAAPLERLHGPFDSSRPRSQLSQGWRDPHRDAPPRELRASRSVPGAAQVVAGGWIQLCNRLAVSGVSPRRVFDAAAPSDGDVRRRLPEQLRRGSSHRERAWIFSDRFHRVGDAWPDKCLGRRHPGAFAFGQSHSRATIAGLRVSIAHANSSKSDGNSFARRAKRARAVAHRAGTNARHSGKCDRVPLGTSRQKHRAASGRDRLRWRIFRTAPSEFREYADLCVAEDRGESHDIDVAVCLGPFPAEVAR